MKKTLISLFLLWQFLLPSSMIAQRIDIDFFAGICNYQGDLQPAVVTGQNASVGAAAIVKYGVTDNIYVRAGFSFGSVAGNDANNKESLKFRNLNFRSGIQEFSAAVEYRFLSSEKSSVRPYVFAGVGVFKFDPYTFTGAAGTRVYLQPLGTEGQGLAAYPEKEMYKLTQFCIPYGMGIKWQLNCNLNVGLEFRHTKTFTDYLDDVSGRYADQNLLLSGRGPLAVDLAWRGDDYNGAPYPAANTLRGNAGQKDWYYFAGLTFGLKLNDCNSGRFSLGGLFNRGKSGVKGMDCPKVW
jgi:Domain of unknown function (DUF6089)